MDARLVKMHVLERTLSLGTVGVALFWSAGTIRWWQAWAALGVWLFWFVVGDTLLFRSSPELVRERLKPPRDAKVWDRAIVSVLRLVQFARYILAGLDQRYGWTGGFARPVEIGALIASTLSWGFFTWAMLTNPYFSQVVRIQIDRGHTLVTGGPYRIVRHPGYAGAIVFELAMSTLLGSWWGIAAAALSVLLLLVRTALEDRTLLRELAGYASYAHLVRYRLVPGVW